MYRALVEIIDDALNHANSTPLPAEAPDLEALARALGVTDAEWEALAMTAEGMSERDAAGLIGISQPAVQKRLRKARAKIVEALT